MKDFFDSLFNSVKDRLSSAFLFNFIFSWCVVNWEIFLALFFVDDKELPCSNLICYIKHFHSDRASLIWWPLLSAIIISILLPLINAYIDFFKSWVKKIRNKEITERIDAKTAVPPAQFISVKNEYEKIQKNYEDSMIEFESIQKSEKELKTKNEELNNTIKELEHDKTYLNSNLIEKTSLLKSIINITNEVIIAVSNEDTMFTHSNFTTSVSKRQSVIVTSRTQDWNENLQKFQNKLGEAKWICDKYPIPDNEAINGGTYVFEKRFDLDVDLKYLEKVTLYCLVDDYLKIEVNGSSVKDITDSEEVSGFRKLIEFDITEYCIKGSNVLNLLVRNWTAGDTIKDVVDKGLSNPYGIVFSLSLKLTHTANLS